MADETLSQEIRGWLGVIFPAAVGAIAIWQDRIRLWMRRPKLEVDARTATPDCDLTHFNAEYLTTDEQGNTSKKFARCYYFRLRVRNVGDRLAEKVEVYVEGVERKQIDGTFKALDAFPPLNLKWAHVGGRAVDLIPGMEKFCDFGYIVDPEALEKCGSAFSLEVSRQRALPTGGPVFTFDLEVKPNHGGHIIGEGTYRIYLAVGAANITAKREYVEMFFSGKWLEPDTKMYSDGLRFNSVKMVT